VGYTQLQALHVVSAEKSTEYVNARCTEIDRVGVCLEQRNEYTVIEHS